MSEDNEDIADEFIKSLYDIGLIETRYSVEKKEQQLKITDMGDKVRKFLNWLESGGKNGV